MKKDKIFTKTKIHLHFFGIKCYNVTKPIAADTIVRSEKTLRSGPCGAERKRVKPNSGGKQP
ncbi:hypothetical protein [Allofournierella massiliensis]|uniref:hypothetical protein n=1 Tax=Allofournierella massiliensis TaxID=1650663 RepID=UPI0035689FA4